jgi:outer membrane receptor protein involved in Fe transport
MNPLGSLFTRHALAAAVAIVAAAPALAQNTSAAIGGRVLTPDGKPVAGATVVVLHVESGSANTLTTDAEGRFSARGLRVGGPYTVTVTKDGLRTVNEDLYLALAETAALDLRLGKVENQLEKVVVTASATGAKFGASNTGAGTAISRAELDAYASVSGNLQDFARLDPRVSQTDKERGEISVAGQNSRYNSITIDGVKINDTFGLESNNLPTRKQPIPLEALQSVQVNVSNYDVTQQGYTGANVNAVTKSGTNDLKGTLKLAYRNDEMAGRRFNRSTGDYFSFLPFEEKTVGMTLGGPIIKDTLFFFASYEELKSDRVQPEFGPVGSPLTNVAISQKAISDAAALAKSQYGIDIGNTDVQASLSVKDALVKLDWNISDKHRANVRVARTEQSDTNNGGFGGFSSSGLALSSNIWQQEKVIDTAVAQWFADWTENFSTELKVSSRDYRSEPLNASNLPAIGLRYSGPAPIGAPTGLDLGNRFLNFGTERSRHFNILDTKTQDLYLGATWFQGDHELKFGGDWSDNKVFNAFFQDAKGNYTFGCQDGWVYNTIPGVAPGTRLPTSGSANRCSSFTAAQMEAAVLENFSLGRPVLYQVQVPVAGKTLEDGIARFSIKNLGLFLQDTWTVSDKLTVTAGVRYDRLGMPGRPLTNSTAAGALVAGSVGTTNASVVRNTGGFGLDNTTVPDGAELVQPRVAFNLALDPVDKLKSQVRGGVGLFQGAAANVWLSNAYSNPGVVTRFVGCGNTGQRNCSDVTDTGVFRADPTQQILLSGSVPAANVDFLARGLAQPSVWKLNLAYDRELPKGFVAGVEWLYTSVKDGIYYKHLNLGAPTRIGAQDGRELYYTPAAYDPTCWTGNGSLSTTGACSGNRNRALSNANFAQVLLAERTGKGGGNTVTLSIGQPRIGDFAWQMAYTRSSATEVSPLTSSVSNSNFNARATFNPNEEVAANSAYLVKDRLSGNLRWSKMLLSGYKTTVGLFYEGRKGKPYSWTYGNDMNGDGVSGNDLMYVPANANDVIIKSGITTGASALTDAQAAAKFWEVVDSNQQLRQNKGKVVGRNGSFSKFTNSFDLRVTQELPAFSRAHKATVNLDLLNVGNMINRRWGRIDEIGFSSAGGQRRSFANFGGIDPATGKYVYYVNGSVTDFTTRQGAGESQWALQVTLRYAF